MTSAIITRIWESLFPLSSRTTSPSGAGSSTFLTASRSRLPKSRKYPEQDEVSGDLCVKIEEHPSCADAVQNSSRRNTLPLSLGVLFKHGPLDHQKSSIRLVTVLPDLSTEGYIQCSMRCTTTHARYTCLSYAWGEPNPKHLLLINGQQFYVQKNLFGFLENTRGQTKYKHVEYWIDALCIDQSNVAERNHQVAQMGMIYSKARYVIAWLGPLDCTLDNVLLYEHIPDLTSIRLRNTRNHGPPTYRSQCILVKSMDHARARIGTPCHHHARFEDF